MKKHIMTFKDFIIFDQPLKEHTEEKTSPEAEIKALESELDTIAVKAQVSSQPVSAIDNPAGRITILKTFERFKDELSNQADIPSKDYRHLSGSGSINKEEQYRKEVLAKQTEESTLPTKISHEVIYSAGTKQTIKVSPSKKSSIQQESETKQ